MGAIVLFVVVVVLIRWRMAHRERRKLELSATRADRQPLTEWSARFPADRSKHRRGRGKSWGF